MPTLYNVPLWLKHADEIRALSRLMTDRQTKQELLSIAAGFERIAVLATQLQSTSKLANEADRRSKWRVWAA